MAMASPPAKPPRQIEVGRVINEAFAIYSAHAAPLILTALAVFAPFRVVEELLNNAGGLTAQLLAAAIGLAGAALYTGFVVKLVEDIREGKRDASIRELFTSAYAYVGALFVNGLLLGAGVGLGFLALIVPAFFLFTIWAVCSPAIVAENRGPIEAFGRSHDLVRGHGWPVFGALVVAGVIQTAALLVAIGIGSGLGEGGTLVISIISTALTGPVSALVTTVLFFDLGGGRTAAASDGQVVIEY